MVIALAIEVMISQNILFLETKRLMKLNGALVISQSFTLYFF